MTETNKQTNKKMECFGLKDLKYTLLLREEKKIFEGLS